MIPGQSQVGGGPSVVRPGDRGAGRGVVDAMAAVARLGDDRAEGGAEQARVHFVDDLFETSANDGQRHRIELEAAARVAHAGGAAEWRTVTLDLAEPKGKELFLGLIKVCDVLVENYRSSVMDRLGLGYDSVSRANPQLIYLKISSQGATGPEANYGSLGSTLEQTAGLASITGYEDGLPLMTNEVYPDPVVGILSFGALMAALRRRRQTGRGCLVDLSQREVTSMLLGESVLDFSVTGRIAATMGNKHRDIAPQGVYSCLGEDMWVAVSAGTDDEWLGLCRAMGRHELAGDPRFKDTGSRQANHDALDEIISSWTRGLDHYQAMHLLQAEGVPAGAVLKGSETIIDPHIEARGFWDVVDHPEAGIYKQTTTPWILSKSPRQPTVPAAGLGEHNYQVLGGLLGLSISEIDTLVEQGITGDVPDPSA